MDNWKMNLYQKAEEVKRFWIEIASELIEENANILEIINKQKESRVYQVKEEDVTKIRQLKKAISQLSLIFDDFIAASENLNLSSSVISGLKDAQKALVALNIADIAAIRDANAKIVGTLTKYQIELTKV
jgi:cell fate (sporulation/competence/biofilm development) regulator YlbF (YheA/YmcA/DUF963 family)